MEIQLPESERRWLHAALVLGTLVLALVLIAQVGVILAFFSDILLILLLAWLLAFILSPLVTLDAAHLSGAAARRGRGRDLPVAACWTSVRSP